MTPMKYYGPINVLVATSKGAFLSRFKKLDGKAFIRCSIETWNKYKGYRNDGGKYFSVKAHGREYAVSQRSYYLLLNNPVGWTWTDRKHRKEYFIYDLNPTVEARMVDTTPEIVELPIVPVVVNNKENDND